MTKTRGGEAPKRLKINGRKDEAGNANAYQITFRTSRKNSAEWSRLRGLCARSGHDEKTPELMEKVLLPAMRDYVARKGYAERARRIRGKNLPRDLGDVYDI